MKPLLTVLCCLVLAISPKRAATQPGSSPTPDSLPAQGLTLDHWRFQAGDDRTWADPDLNDSSWKSVSLSRYTDWAASYNTHSVGWFRTWVRLDSTTQSQPLALVISQFGASEVYLNGKLFLNLGIIGSGGAMIQANNPQGKPFLFRSGTATDTIFIAIRFASTSPWRPPLLSGSPLSVQLNRWPEAVNDFRNDLIKPRTQLSISAICIALGLLFVVLYLFLPKERINILFAGFCFTAGLGRIILFKLDEGNMGMHLNVIAVQALLLLSKSSGMLIISLITIELQGRLNRFLGWMIFYILVVDSLIWLFFAPAQLAIWSDNLSRLVFTSTLILLCLLAVRRKNYTILFVAISGVVLNILFLASRYSGKDVYTVPELYNFITNFVALAVYIAYKYARTSNKLMAQMDETARVSAEKEQLLAQQNETLERQVTERTAQLTQSLKDLKEAQAQLIQSEKMASLGELTAGIAHEIQNPLNFVNNFSEVNEELIDEMNQELAGGHAAAASEIADDIRQNLEKIKFHGKRADGIVKSMLMHSRQNAGGKEPTDLNNLVDEYFRLSYHGLRARDKQFNALMETHFDEHLGKVPVMAQDIGRVILNLVNNAFYSVTEKKKKIGAPFEPKVTVSTKRSGTWAEIGILDNGMGIAPGLIDKIFNPFFTSKPTGQGTGLGLSISYDIVTKEHNGKLSVTSVEGEYALFLIQLPV